MRLRLQLLIPTLCLILLFAGVGSWFMRVVLTDLGGSNTETTRELSEAGLEKSIQIQVNNFRQVMDLKSAEALRLSAFIAGLEEVRQAYAIAHNGNIEDELSPESAAARKMLKDHFRPLTGSFVQITGDPNLQIHFHLPLTRSLARIWRDGWQATRNGVQVDVSDDMPDFRHTLRAVNSPPYEPVLGIEVGRAGMVLRGISPIRDEKGNHLGSVEVITGFDAVLEQIDIDAQTDIVTFMDTDQLEIATSLADSSKYPVFADNFVRVAGTNDSLLGTRITPEILRAGRNQLTLDRNEGFLVAAFPIPDFQGRPRGVQVFVQDVSATDAKIASMLAESQRMIQEINLKLVVAAVLAIVLFGGALFLISQRLLHTLRRAIRDIREGSREVTTASDEIARTGTSLAQGAQEQSATVDMVTQAIESITEESRNTAKLTDGAATMMNENIEKSGASLKALVEMNQGMTQLQENSHMMGGIITNINEIAFKTNLLAINASIEAAKAGEAGRGFSVVANEIRTLASQAAEAADNTRKLLDGNISEVTVTSSKIGRINENFEAIVETATAMGEKIASIKSATESISRNLGTIHHSASEMRDLNQNYAAQAEEFSASASELNSQADALRGVVQGIEAVVEGSRAARPDNFNQDLDNTDAGYFDGDEDDATIHEDEDAWLETADPPRRNGNGKAHSLFN